MSKKILVTGASGFVGSHLIEEFLWNTDWQVYAGIRQTSSRKYITDDRVRFCSIDLNNLSASRDELEVHAFDIVVHNAGLTQARTKSDYIRVNAEASRQFYELLAGLPTPPQRFIYMSSAAASGPADYTPEGIVRRDSPPHPVTDYGRSKLLAEQYIQSDHRIPYVIIRPSVIYGPREYNMLTVFKMLHRGLDVQLGRVDREYTFIYVKDLTRMVRMVIEQGIEGKLYFAASERWYSSDELATFASRILGRNPFRIKLAMPLVWAAAAMSQGWSTLTRKASIFNLDKMNEINKISWKMDVQPQQDELGYRDRYTLESGLEETISWYRDHKWL